MYLITVDDGSSIFDIRVEDLDVPKEIDRLLLEEGHKKVLAERIEE